MKKRVLIFFTIVLVSLTGCSHKHSDNNKEKMIRDNKELTNKLVNLYKKSGFKEVKYNNKEPYLIKICNP